MTTASFWRHRAVRHAVGWLLALGVALAVVSQVVPPKLPQVLADLPLQMLLLAVPVYVHSWLLTHWLEQGRRARYALATATTVAGGTLLDLAHHWLQARPDGAGDELLEVVSSVTGVMLMLLIATGLHYLRRGILSHYHMKQLHARQVETELSLLKAQVNQHFLFNTLNNLYGLSLAAPEQMPEALLQLAGLMRYQLDSSRQSTVTVGTEAEYLANYIGLEKLRLRSNTRVEFSADLPHPDRPLAPLLLLPLVENCFKHAVGPSGENTIRICLTQTDTGLTLRTDNSIPPHFRPLPSGLGLPTLRARLAQFYPGPRHRFTVEATATHFAATLRLAF